jgi:RimJ/RimL family protein N-acetyltransferase
VTSAARLLTTAAFAVDGIERVEIWHEPANTASGAVPARLGFTAVGEIDGDRVWRTTRGQWALVSSDA